MIFAWYFAYHLVLHDFCRFCRSFDTLSILLFQHQISGASNHSHEYTLYLPRNCIFVISEAFRRRKTRKAAVFARLGQKIVTEKLTSFVEFLVCNRSSKNLRTKNSYVYQRVTKVSQAQVKQRQQKKTTRDFWLISFCIALMTECIRTKIVMIQGL